MQILYILFIYNFPLLGNIIYNQWKMSILSLIEGP